MAEITEPLAKDDTCIDVEPAEIKSTGKRLPKANGGGFEFVTSLPQEGGDSGVEYLLVDDAESPTQFFGGYMYEDENWIQTSLATNQLVVKVDELPETGEEGVLYYLEKEDETDTFDLYRWINDEWVKLDTDVKLYTTMGINVDGPMTQKATTNMLYPEGEETTRSRVYIPIHGDLTHWGLQIDGGGSNVTTQSESIVIGRSAGASSGYNPASVVIVGCRATTESAYGGVAIGYSAKAGGTLPVAIGRETYIPHTTTTKYGVALGYGSRVTQGRQSVMSIGSGQDNDWRTRVIENVTDPSLPQDAATKHYVDNLVIPTINLGEASSSSTFLSSTSFADIITQYPNSHIFKLDYDRATWGQEYAYWYPNGSYLTPSATNSIRVMKGAVMFVQWSDDAKTSCRGVIINGANQVQNNAALTFYAAASTGWRMESYDSMYAVTTYNGILNLLDTRAATISNNDWSTLWQ